MVKLVDGLVAAIAIACFTPLVIPPGQFAPTLAGIPYTMWVGFLASVLLVLFTALVSIIKKKENDGQ